MDGSTFNAYTLVVLLVSLIVSITLHEMMHAFVDFKLGDTTAHEEGRVSLNPLKHIDPFMTIILPLITLWQFHVPILAAKPVPFNPERVKYDEYGAALIAAAGPFTNLGLAILGALGAHLFAGNSTIVDVLVLFVTINISLFIFNLVPIPPLDGSRVLYAFAPEPVQNFMAQLEQYGIFIVFGLALFVPAFSEVLININQAISRVLL